MREAGEQRRRLAAEFADPVLGAHDSQGPWVAGFRGLGVRGLEFRVRKVAAWRVRGLSKQVVSRALDVIRAGLL